MHHTTDGGTTWRATPTPGAFAVRQLIMPDSLTIWAFGTSGMVGRIMASSDGGRSWALKYDHLGDLLFGGAVLSPRVILATGTWRAPNSGDSALILRSSDGGASWQRWTTLQCPQLGHIQRLDSLTAFTAFLPNQVLLRTTDAGARWIALPIPNAASAVTFLDLNRAVMHRPPRFLRTVDSGIHWDVTADLTDSLGHPPLDDFQAYMLSFPENSLSGWAFGGVVDLGAITDGIYHTTDGGYHWQKESEGLTSWEIQDACMTDNRHGWAVSGDGRILAYRPVPDTTQPDKPPPLPSAYALEQNFPNPFNPTTTIRYSLPSRSLVTLAVFNALGQRVAELVSGPVDAGFHEVQFNAGNLASGIYFYRLQVVGKYVQTKALCIVR